MKKLNLCGTWEMTGEDGRSFPSEVPGSVLNTLLEYGEIPDPFDGMNEFTACAETRRSLFLREKSMEDREEYMLEALRLAQEANEKLCEMEKEETTKALNLILLTASEKMRNGYNLADN